MAALIFDDMRDNLLTALRMSDTAANVSLINELEEIFSACLDDLRGAGADISKNQSLIKQAIIFYCKANFGLEANEKWQALYERTRNALASRTAEIGSGNNEL